MMPPFIALSSGLYSGRVVTVLLTCVNFDLGTVRRYVGAARCRARFTDEIPAAEIGSLGQLEIFRLHGGYAVPPGLKDSPCQTN